MMPTYPRGLGWALRTLLNRPPLRAPTQTPEPLILVSISRQASSAEGAADAAPSEITGLDDFWAKARAKIRKTPLTMRLVIFSVILLCRPEAAANDFSAYAAYRFDGFR